MVRSMQNPSRSADQKAVREQAGEPERPMCGWDNVRITPLRPDHAVRPKARGTAGTGIRGESVEITRAGRRRQALLTNTHRRMALPPAPCRSFGLPKGASRGTVKRTGPIAPHPASRACRSTRDASQATRPGSDPSDRRAVSACPRIAPRTAADQFIAVGALICSARCRHGSPACFSGGTLERQPASETAARMRKTAGSFMRGALRSGRRRDPAIRRPEGQASPRRPVTGSRGRGRRRVRAGHGSTGGLRFRRLVAGPRGGRRMRRRGAGN